MSQQKRLFLFDAYALIYRSYFAFIRTPRINSKGFNTSAIFGFTNTIDQVLKREKPTHAAVVFDPKGKTFRNEMFSDYKANREETPEDIRNSIPYIKQIIEALNINIFEVDNYEADDVIGTIATRAEKDGYEVFMMTPDKDFAQLVTDNVKMYKPARGGNDNEILGVEQVKAKFGIQDPKQVIDILALWGDSADNIPGAPGVGEKTSKKLIAKYYSVEGLLENTNDLKGKQKENIENFKEQILLSKELATIIIDVPLELNLNNLEVKEYNKDGLNVLFDELEFKNLTKRLIPEVQAKPQHAQKIQQTSMNLFGDTEPEDVVYQTLDNIKTIKHNYHEVNSFEQRKTLIDKLFLENEFAFDTETTSLDANNAELVGLSFCCKSHEAYWVPLPNTIDDCKKILEEFRPLFENPLIRKVGQNIKYDMLILKWYDMEIKGELFDTMIAHYLIQPDQRHNLDSLAENYLNYKTVGFEEITGKGKNQINMRQAFSLYPNRVKDYAAEDADITWQLKLLLEKELETNGLTKLATNIEMPLIPVLCDMEKSGVKINIASLKNYSVELTELIINIEKEIHDLAGVDFNISSPKQMGEVLFKKLKLDDKAKKTKTGQFSTNEEILVKLRTRHPIIDKVLDFRGYKKLLSTYVDALPKLVNQKTGKIHTSYMQAVAATGRLSSVNPNLQNIPIRDEMGKKIRKVFIPSDDEHIFFSADYSQIELRLMADLSQDKNLLQAFINKEDVHAATASKIYKTPINEVSSEMRGRAKTANFGIIYGISAFGLSQRLNISRKEGKELIDGYFENYPSVKEYMDKSISIARGNGYVETMMGRKRQLPDINSRNAVVRSNAERNAINAPIQGSAADIIKLAMINIYTKMNEAGLKSKMILQVHDELNFDVLKSELDKVKAIVIAEMENAVKLSIPLTVEYGEGNNWLEAH